MKKSVFFMAAVLAALVCSSCSRENDFLIMGKQQIFLDFPLDGDAFAPGFGGDKLSFRWHSKRHFADNEYVFSDDPELLNPVTLVCGSTYQQTFLTGNQIDSVAALLGIAPTESCVLFWQIRTVDPEQGWCEEVRKLYFTRLPGVTKQIIGVAPAPSMKFYCESGGNKVLEFSWNCDKKIYDYVLWLSDDKEFESDHTRRIELGESMSYSITESRVDAMLEDWGYGISQKADIYWKVTGSGDAWIPVEESPRRTVKARRIAPPAVELVYSAPSDNSELDLALVSGNVEFSWSTTAQNVSYSLSFHDDEFDRTWSVDCGKNLKYSVSADELDSILQNNFGMVASQKKKLTWSVIASPEDAVILPEKPYTVIIKRK